MTTKNDFMLQYKNNDVYSLVIDKLKQIDVNHFIIKWYFSFLANRSQHVFSYHVISTRAPRGVWAPKSLSYCTQMVVWAKPLNYIVKFSDNTAIPSLLYKDQNISSYHSEIKQFVEWWDAHHLIVNVKKSEEMIFDLKLIGECCPVFIQNVPIWYNKCLYIIILAFILVVHSHGMSMLKTCALGYNKECIFLRRLRLYGVSSKIMFLFYQAVECD